MLGRQVSPRLVGILVVLVLLVVQVMYWRLLIYQPPPPGGGRMAGGGSPPPIPVAMGRQDVRIETFAGEEPGFADGPRWAARFSGPSALAREADGSLLVADSRNHRIRRIAPSGRVTTIAGGGEPGGPGGEALGPALAARFRFPSGVAVGPDGTIYIADTGNRRLCRLRDGQVTRLAGGPPFRYPAALFWHGGVLWVADPGLGRVLRVTADGRVAGGDSRPGALPAEVARRLGGLVAGPAGLAIQASPDARGEPEPTAFRLGRASAGDARSGVRLFADLDHHVLMGQRPGEPPLLLAGRREGDRPILGTEDGEGHRSRFALPCAVLLAPDGTAFVADYEGNRIRRAWLPGWFLNGEPPPAGGPRGDWRSFRGR